MLTKGCQRIMLVSGTDAGHDHDDVVDPVKPVSHASFAAFSATQANCALRHGCQALLAVCVDAQSAADASCAAVHGGDVTSSMHDESQLMHETELVAFCTSMMTDLCQLCLRVCYPNATLGILFHLNVAVSLHSGMHIV